MRIAGLVKNSFLDYPGLIAAVVFVPGCNMDCWYCHNRALWRAENLLDTAQVKTFLEKHRGFLDGVVISGGEPTLQAGLPAFIRDVRGMGYRVKLDTNGLEPGVVEALLPELDYVAMDLKAPPGQLFRVVSFHLDDAPVWQCAELLMKSGVDYEFRTTFMPTLEPADIEAIAQRVRGARRYVLQQYRRTDARSLSPEPHRGEIIKKAAEAAGKYVHSVVIRGI
jgi:pyruvate formate lyase activating enzyme